MEPNDKKNTDRSKVASDKDWEITFMREAFNPHDAATIMAIHSVILSHEKLETYLKETGAKN